MFTKLTQILDSYLELGIPGYDCIVYHKGECVYRRMNGYSDRENKIPVSGNELYYIYSCSKVMTVTAALQLYERGLFRLDDKLEKYIPEYATMYIKGDGGELRTARNSITVKDIFCMTAGFSYKLSNPAIAKFKEETGGICPTGEFARYMAGSVLDFEPGTAWQYSFCHDILASLVELWSGEKFGEYMRKNIFEPAGMKNSTFRIDESDLEKLCPQYSFDFNTKLIGRVDSTNVYRLGSAFESGGAGCVTTAMDCIKFAEALRQGKLLKEETIALMTKNHIEHCMESFILEKYAYGLGVRCPTGNDDVSDFGWGGAAGAGMWIDIEHGISAYYAQHVLNSPVIKKRNEIIFTIKEALGYGEATACADTDDADDERAAFARKYGI